MTLGRRDNFGDQRDACARIRIDIERAGLQVEGLDIARQALGNPRLWKESSVGRPGPLNEF